MVRREARLVSSLIRERSVVIRHGPAQVADLSLRHRNRNPGFCGACDIGVPQVVKAAMLDPDLLSQLPPPPTNSAHERDRSQCPEADRWPGCGGHDR